MELTINETELMLLSATLKPEYDVHIDYSNFDEAIIINNELLKRVKEYKNKYEYFDFCLSKDFFSDTERQKLANGWRLLIETDMPKCFANYWINRLRESKYRDNLKLSMQDYINSENSLDTLTNIKDKLEKLDLKINVKSDNEYLSMQSDKYMDTLSKKINGEYKTYKTGFYKIDDIIKCIYQGTSIIIGARTSIGKTALLLNIAYNMAKDYPDETVLFISSEMSANQLIDRIVSRLTTIRLDYISNGENIDSKKMNEIKQAIDRISRLKFVIMELSRFDENEINKYIKLYNPKFIFIDYLQRFNLKSSNKNDTRASMFSDIANNIKSISVEHDLICFTASQLSRQVEHRQDKIVTLADLKESGGIEESADIVMLIEAKENSNKVTLKIAKNRQGMTGNIELTFYKEFCTFE